MDDKIAEYKADIDRLNGKIIDLEGFLAEKPEPVTECYNLSTLSQS